MENKKYRYLNLVDRELVQCAFCGHLSEVAGDLSEIAKSWSDADVIEFSCIECGNAIRKFGVSQSRTEIAST